MGRREWRACGAQGLVVGSSVTARSGTFMSVRASRRADPHIGEPSLRDAAAEDFAFDEDDEDRCPSALVLGVAASQIFLMCAPPTHRHTHLHLLPAPRI